METIKKLFKASNCLAFTSLVLAFSIVVLFLGNVGFGWTNGNHLVNANGMIVGSEMPNSPVHDYGFYFIDQNDPDSAVADSDPNGTPDDLDDDILFDRYTFTKLGDDEEAEMNMGNYNKLERPTYHVLLHIALKKDEDLGANAKIYVDSLINGSGKTTITKSEIPNMISSGTPLGLSSAVEFYLIRPTLLSQDTNGKKYTINWNATTSQFVFEDRYLPETGKTFEMDETTTTLSFESSNNIFDPIDPETCEDVDGDGYRDLFIFITYNAELINRLQYYSTTQGESMDGKSISFTNDFSLRIRKED